ncbi:NUDIX hydrolase [Rhizorhapis sp. SPR117]|uniref:NUDIX hydrolase n=1 Tax=Rhizorhapis sp. SPR117 TaxID=2912611 RepID=UPI0023518863
MITANLPPTRAAATLVIFRDRANGPAELLMMERSRQMEFAGGALVFPGGAIDSEDAELAMLHGAGLELEEATARVAAIRETLEECGLALGFATLPDAVVTGQIRDRMTAGEGLAALLAEHGLGLDLEQLVPFARWHPKMQHARIYDTRFYLARLPDESHAARVDATENVHLLWASARDVLNRAERGEAHVIFPTRRNLERLAQFPDFESASTHARSTPVTTISPWIEERSDGRYLCIPDELGYPITSEALETTHRG